MIKSANVQKDIIENVILHRERDDISDGDFRVIAKALLQCCPTTGGHPLVQSLAKLYTQLAIPPEKRPPGMAGSKPK